MGGVTPDKSREVPIPERSGTASRKGPGLARPIKSVHFRLQNLACQGLRARVVAAWGQLPERSPGWWLRSGSKPAHRSQRRNSGNGSLQAVPVFLVFSEVSEDPLPLLRGPPACLVSVCWWPE